MLIDKGFNNIPIKDCHTVAQSCDVVNIEATITFFHHQGIIVHPSESKVVVLDQPWLMNLFTNVITMPDVEHCLPIVVKGGEGGDPPSNCVQDHSNPCRSWGADTLECLRRLLLAPPPKQWPWLRHCFQYMPGPTSCSVKRYLDARKPSENNRQCELLVHVMDNQPTSSFHWLLLWKKESVEKLPSSEIVPVFMHFKHWKYVPSGFYNLHEIADGCHKHNAVLYCSINMHSLSICRAYLNCIFACTFLVQPYIRSGEKLDWKCTFLHILYTAVGNCLNLRSRLSTEHNRN